MDPRPRDASGPRIVVDRCSSCHGVWFDRGEVQAAIRAAKIPRSTRTQTVRSGPPAGPCGPCPRCGEKLKAAPSQVVPELEYDRCLRCDGIWFDAGEAEQLADDVGILALMLHEFDGDEEPD